MNRIENWWRHCGCYDREQASGIPYTPELSENYLQATDDWWDTLSDKAKRKVFEEFFSED